MAKTAFLFPGQGAQYPGMAKDLWGYSVKVKELFEYASDIVKLDLKKLLFEGTEEELKATDKTQISVTLASLSASAVLKENGINPEGFAGFSLGEYSALSEAGVLKLEDLFNIVKVRGELMEKASRDLDSAAGNAGMAAVIGLTFDKAVSILEGLQGKDVYLANYSSPAQVVLSGTANGLSAAEAAFKEAGARRFIRLKVSGPFHSPLLESARKGLADFLSDIEFSDPEKAVYANVSGDRIKSGEDAKKYCIQQVVATVKWVTEEENLLRDGFDAIYEVGPGKVLSGLWRSFNRDIVCTPVGTLDAVKQILEG
ncbi:MAG: ACP S-malonyltransferase [Spirochaetales bacterium]|nr:ACP S-malonyltransferase [Spirochaetales bacterium]